MILLLVGLAGRSIDVTWAVMYKSSWSFPFVRGENEGESARKTVSTSQCLWMMECPEGVLIAGVPVFLHRASLDQLHDVVILLPRDRLQ
jgi:hypothetical protein